MSSFSRLTRCCWLCVSGSPIVAAAWSGFVHMTIMLFGRSIVPIVIGCCGVLAAVDVYYGVSIRGSRRALRRYALFSFLSLIASIASGVIALAGVDAECASQSLADAKDRDTCTLQQSVDGILLFSAASSASFFAAISAALAYFGHGTWSDASYQHGGSGQGVKRRRGGGGGGESRSFINGSGPNGGEVFRYTTGDRKRISNEIWKLDL